MTITNLGKCKPSLLRFLPLPDQRGGLLVEASRHADENAFIIFYDDEKHIYYVIEIDCYFGDEYTLQAVCAVNLRTARGPVKKYTKEFLKKRYGIKDCKTETILKALLPEYNLDLY